MLQLKSIVSSSYLYISEDFSYSCLEDSGTSSPSMSLTTSPIPFSSYSSSSLHILPYCSLTNPFSTSVINCSLSRMFLSANFGRLVNIWSSATDSFISGLEINGFFNCLFLCVCKWILLWIMETLFLIIAYLGCEQKLYLMFVVSIPLFQFWYIYF